MEVVSDRRDQKNLLSSKTNITLDKNIETTKEGRWLLTRRKRRMEMCSLRDGSTPGS